MLYDCHSDRLVPSLTLWDPSMLQQATDQRPQSTCNFELISDDSLASKTFHLGVQANLKLSFFTGLISTAGSAKYLNDCKSSNKLQARVTLKYSSTTRFDELAIEKLGAVRYSKVRGKATHIVTGVLYGADAFFVFDQEVAPGGNYQAVHENMKKVIKLLPGTVTVTDMTEVQCTVYCDFQLPENPTSFQDAAKCLKELPRLADSSTSAVPKRVQLFPLNKLDSSAGKIAHEISPVLVTETEIFMEMFHELQMQCNDILRTEVSTYFPAIQKQLSRFQQMLTVYKSSMIKQLAGLLPRVRGGETQEADMSKIFNVNEDSPFRSQRMLSWLCKKEREVTVLTSYLKSMKGIPFVASPNELDAIVSNFEYDFVLCFSFLVTDEHDAYLQCLSDYLRAPQLKQKFDDALPQHWHEDRTVVRDMRSQARQFKDFAEANRMQQRTTFIVSSCANLVTSCTKGAITILFRDGLPEKFLLPSQPGKATSTKVTNDSILLEWSTPTCGAESVQSYTISYCVENDSAEQWKIKRTRDSGNTTMIAQLTPNTKYHFKVHAQCEVGVSPQSEISDPIETRPNKPNQDGDEMQVSSKPVVSYPAVFNSKVPISHPGKPNASKVTSNSIHLNWYTAESDVQSIKFYSVLYRRMDDLSSQWETLKTQGAEEFAEVSGLAAKAVYCFKVRAECEAGVSPDSEMSDPIVTGPSPVPGKPGIPTVSKVTHNSIHLNWPGPRSGVESVKCYSVIYRRMDDPSAEWQTTKTHDSQKEVTVSGLAAKAVYCFKVRAESEAGASFDSEMCNPILTSHPPVPGRPGKPIVSKVTHDSIHLNWPIPKSGIEGVKFYTVIYRRMDDPSAEWQTTKTHDSQKEVTVSGLVAKTVYCFKVRAESEGGVSPDSELCDPIATSSPPVPGKPGKPMASKVTHNSIQLKWPGPKSGIEVVEYYSVIYHRMDDPSAKWQTTKTHDSQKEVTMSGLAAKAVYCFKVRAESEAGASSDSEMCNPILTSHPPVPGRPGKPIVSKVTHDSIHLNWPIPKSGIEGVKFYTVIYRRMDDPSAEWQTTKTHDSQKEVTVSGLVAKTVYCFKVRAESEGGVSPDSELCDPIATSSPPVPGKPGKPMASKVTHNSIQLKWPGPKSGIEVVEYYSVIYRRMDDPSAKWQTTKTHDSQKEVTMSGLVAKAVYCFKVRAESEAGFSPDSEMCDPIATSPAPLPGRPGKPIATKVTHNSVELNWSGPESHIKYYLVSYRQADEPSSYWQTLKTQDARHIIKVSGLAAKTMYCFKVCTECEAGHGPESEVNQITTRPLPIPSHPGKPNAVDVSHCTIKVNWSHPQHGAENVKCYTVSYCKTNGSTEHWQETQTSDAIVSLTVGFLDAKTKYRFKVRAESESGASSWSEVSLAIETHSRPPPSQPSKPYFLSVSHDTVVLNWSRSKPNFGAKDVKYYTVSYYEVDDCYFPDKWKTKKTAGPQESVTVTGLRPNALYCFHVRAESDGGCSSSSESSDPIQLHAPPAPSQPGKPTASDNDIIANSILLKWAKPAQGGDYVKRYSISYRKQYDPVDQWQTKLSDGARTALTVSGLDPKTEYHFKVHAVSDNGISMDSGVSIFYTKAEIRLAERMLSSAVMTENGPPAIYKLKLQEVTVDGVNQLQKCAIGKPDVIRSPEEKVVMVVGATGAGKTTLINGMTNYLLGVEWGDGFRFKLIDEKTGSQAESQTKWIAAYTFHHQMGSPLPYTLTIIDTPGFGDTRGIERDHCITEQIKGLFSMPPPHCIDHMNAIAVVTQAALARLTPTQKYIFDSILAIFGKDIASNIFMMVTFADGGVPPVLAAIKAANIPSCELFKFNNSSLRARPNDTFGKMFWEMGLKSFEDFFAHLKTVETRSLRLTREVLDKRKHLDAIIQDLLPNVKTIMPTMGQELLQEMIREAQQILSRLDEISLKPNPLNQLDCVDLLIESEKQQFKPGYKKRLEHLQEARHNAELIHQIREGSISTVSTFHTHAKVRLAERMLSSAVMIEKGPPAIYKLKLQEVTVDGVNQLQKCAIGKPDFIRSPEEKVVMVVGATGAGKTTLINGMTNYLLGVEWGDGFRFKLIDEKTGSQAESQTKWIAAYTFHHQMGSPLPYTLTIIDTPGFGDTRGIERDHCITEQIKGLFSMPPPHCIDHMNAIAVVTQAALARLTPTQKYIFDSILAIFGEDIASNIFMMVTFADGGVPPVLAAIKAANIPSCDFFKFNNSSLCAQPDDAYGKMFWQMGLKSFEDFFAHLKTVDTRSLRLTREVLDKHKHLDAIVQDLLPNVKTIMPTMEQELLQEMVSEAQQILSRLDEIALKPNPLSQLDYVDLLIESEKQQCKLGYMKRLEHLQEARHNAELIHQIREGGDAPQWLRVAVLKAKEKMKERSRSVESPQHVRMQTLPTARTRQYPSKSRWWPFQ